MKIHPLIPRLLEKIKHSQFHRIEMPTIQAKYLKRDLPFIAYVENGKVILQVMAINEDEAYEKVYDYLNDVDDDDTMEL